MTHNKNEEHEFLKTYDPSKYDRPSVTADIVILTIGPGDRLATLLIQRKGHPYKDCWALPGGFVRAGKESATEAAARELYEETGLEGMPLRQLYTFSDPKRDPRTHVISVAYTALVPYAKLQTLKADDDAKDAGIFEIECFRDTLLLSDRKKGIGLDQKDLAFDHAEIIRMAVERIRGRISYEMDAFDLLADKNSFTIYELKQIFEAVNGRPANLPNFRKMFSRNYAADGIVEPTGEYSKDSSKRPAALFRVTSD